LARESSSTKLHLPIIETCGVKRQLIQLLAGFEHTKIIATHDLDMALDLCSRTIVLREGGSWPTAPRTRS
jgi:ABC-type sulfate/molybdate transport systems ATPase subunit